MKKKTYIKQGAYQKVENTRGVDIKGALNLNKEVLDTLVDKTLAGTVDCCQYFPMIPILNVENAANPQDAETVDVPCQALFIARSDTVLYIYMKDCIANSYILLGTND